VGACLIVWALGLPRHVASLYGRRARFAARAGAPKRRLRRTRGPNRRAQLVRMALRVRRIRRSRIATRSCSSCASREGRLPAGERSECEPKPRIVPCEAITNQVRRGQRSGPTSGAAGVGRAPGARSEAKRARRAVSRRVTAGHQEPHGYRGERGACRRHLAVRDRAEGARLSALRGGSSTSPTAEGGPRGSSDAFREEDEQCSSAAIGLGFSAHRAGAAPRGLLRGDRA